MRKSAFFIVAAMSAFAVAACSPAGETDSAASGDGAAATPAAMDGPAPGLWRLTSTSSIPGAPAMPPTEVCVTAAQFDTSQTSGATAGADCQTTPLARQGDAMVGGATCNLPGGGTSTSEIRISGDFSRNYTMETTVRMDPAPTPDMASITSTVSAERLGDCPAT